MVRKKFFDDIDKNNKLPFYHQVYLNLLDKIRNGDYKANDKIPNESDLCKKFNVSRTTIRIALKELENKGYIYRERAKGTFISDKSIEIKSLQKVKVISIVDSLSSNGIDIKRVVLKNKIIKPDERIKSLLNTDNDTKVLFIERLIYALGEPLYVTRVYYPVDIIKRIKNEDIENNSFTNLIEKDFNMPFLNIKKILEPILPDAYINRLLQFKESEPIVVQYQQTITTVIFSGSKRLFYAEDFFKGGRAKFVFNNSLK
jgi:GntR family transcriptional regulator